MVKILETNTWKLVGCIGYETMDMILKNFGGVLNKYGKNVITPKMDICEKVFKNGACKICEIQLLKIRGNMVCFNDHITFKFFI